MNQEQRLLHHASRMAAVTLVSRVSGYLRDKALSWVLGAGDLNDAYRTANRIPNAFRALFAEGSLHAAFVPMVSQLSGGDPVERERARELVRGLLAVLMLLLAVVVGLGIWFAPWLVRLYGEGFSDIEGKLELTVYMNRIMFPYLALISFAALLQGVLNSHERFLLSASTPILFNLTVAIVAFAVVPGMEDPATVLAVSVLVGGSLQAAVQVPAVRALGFHLRPLWRQMWSTDVRQVLLLMLPGIPVLGINQLNQLITNRFASYLGEGGVTFIYYAYRVTELMFGLVVVQLTTVLLPMLSRELRISPDTAPTTLMRTVRMVSFVTLPAATVMALLSRPMIGLLFGGGRFDAAAVTITGATLTGYAFSLVGTGQVKVMASAFFAQRNTRVPMYGSMVSLVVFTASCWLVVDHLGAPGLGWANTIAMACYATFLTVAYTVRHGFGSAPVRVNLLAIGRQAIACCVMAAAVFPCRSWLWSIDTTSVVAACKLGSVLLAAGLLYLAVLTLLGGSELKNLGATLKRRSNG